MGVTQLAVVALGVLCGVAEAEIKDFYISVEGGAAGGTAAVVGLSAVYELEFDAFEPNSFGTLTVFGGVAGAANKCAMTQQTTSRVSLSEDHVVSSTTLVDIEESPLFPGATKLMTPAMQWYKDSKELGYLVVPQGVLPNYGLIPDWDAVALRNAGVVFARVPATSCGTRSASAASAGSEL